jgi:hypothetical protein
VAASAGTGSSPFRRSGINASSGKRANSDAGSACPPGSFMSKPSSRRRMRLAALAPAVLARCRNAGFGGTV